MRRPMRACTLSMSGAHVHAPVSGDPCAPPLPCQTCVRGRHYVTCTSIARWAGWLGYGDEEYMKYGTVARQRMMLWITAKFSTHQGTLLCMHGRYKPDVVASTRTATPQQHQLTTGIWPAAAAGRDWIRMLGEGVARRRFCRKGPDGCYAVLACRMQGRGCREDLWSCIPLFGAGHSGLVIGVTGAR